MKLLQIKEKYFWKHWQYNDGHSSTLFILVLRTMDNWNSGNSELYIFKFIPGTKPPLSLTYSLIHAHKSLVTFTSSICKKNVHCLSAMEPLTHIAKLQWSEGSSLTFSLAFSLLNVNNLIFYQWRWILAFFESILNDQC